MDECFSLFESEIEIRLHDLHDIHLKPHISFQKQKRNK